MKLTEEQLEGRKRRMELEHAIQDAIFKYDDLYYSDIFFALSTVMKQIASNFIKSELEDEEE